MDQELDLTCFDIVDIVFGKKADPVGCPLDWDRTLKKSLNGLLT
jgi:hypothetical protein